MSTKTYEQVPPAVWDCVQAASIKEHGTIYAPTDPADVNKGTATTKTIVGTIVLDFEYDPDGETITYTINSKPFIVSESQVWGGVESSIETCQKSQ